MELRKMSIDYERRRMQLQVYYGNSPLPSVLRCLQLFPVFVCRHFKLQYCLGRIRILRIESIRIRMQICDTVKS